VSDSPKEFRTAETEETDCSSADNADFRKWNSLKTNLRESVKSADALKMNFLEKLKAQFAGKEKPEHLRRGELGERAAKRHLQKLGLKFLAFNFRSARGEIDLIFRDDENPFIGRLDAPGESGGRAQTAAAFANGAGLFAPAEKSAGENPVRHRRGVAGGRRCARSAASAGHVRDGQAVSLRVNFACVRR